MRSTRIAVFAAMLGALALLVLSATTASAATVPTAATAAPAASCHHRQDDRRRGLGLRHLRLPGRPYAPGLTGLQHVPASG